MSEVIHEPSRTPGIVIFVAVLNFLSSGVFFVLSVLSTVVLIFGNVMGIYDFVTRQITQHYQTPNVSLGFNFVFAGFLVVSLVFMLFFVMVGVGLLKGKRLAWYFQVALSVMGLLGIPFGTILNIVILIFFFQSPVRDYFKV